MARKFTSDDRDKEVVTAEGNRVGTISSVDDDDRATVDRDDDQSLTDKVKDMLGWGDDDDDHELRSEHVDEDYDDDDRIRLRRHS
jgi:hypothetical protein